MKQMLLAALLIPVICAAQKQKDPSEKEVSATHASLPTVEDRYEWTEIIQTDTSLKKDDLYRNAKLFFTNEFKSAKDVIQYDDRNEGKVVGKGDFHIEDYQTVFLNFFSDKRNVNFTLEVYCKDGRYKYRIYGVNADCLLKATGSSTSRDIVTTDNISLDGAYDKCSKGMTKKMDRRLFMATIYEIESTISDLKRGMTAKKSDDSF